MKARARKDLRSFGIFCGAFLLLAALFIAEEHIRGRLALHRYLKEMSARGEKFTIAALTPARAPLDQNGASLMMGTSFPESEILSVRTPASLRFISGGVAVAAAPFRSWLVSGQSHLLLTTNTAAFNIDTNAPLSDANTNASGIPRGSVRGRRGVSTQTTWKVVTAEDVATELAPYSNSLARVRAALEYPQLDHGMSYWQGYNVLLPHLAGEKRASQWLRAASFSALQETNLDASLDNLLALAAFSHATTNEPMLISQLVRIAIAQITVAAIWEALQVEGWKEEQLAELQAALNPDDFVSSIARACAMERAMGNLVIERSPKDVFPRSDYNLQWSTPTFPPVSAEESLVPLKQLSANLRPAFIRYVYLPLWRVAWRDQDKLRLMKYWEGQINLAHEQMKQADWATRQQALDDYAELLSHEHSHGELRSFYDEIRYLCSSLLAGSAGRALRRAVDSETTHGLARTALALRRYHLAHGDNPEFLNQLIPQYLSGIPVDPFDGKPMRYRRNANDSFTLYSVGENGKDDGGDATVGKPDTKPSLVKGRDIVWPRAATQQEIQEFAERSVGSPRKAPPQERTAQIATPATNSLYK